MRVTILGCGPSAGVPRVGGPDGAGWWGVCDPANPFNRRRRSAILVETGTTSILVDTGPDLRLQLLDARVRRLDAVIWTHDHGDHSHGLDDLRPLVPWGQRLTGYARPDVLAGLSARFAYAFHGSHGYPAVLQGEALPDHLTIGDLDIAVVDQPHGAITSAGLVISHQGRRVGYATDCATVTDAMAAHYQNLDLWIVEAFGPKPHPIHMNLDRSLAAIAELAPDRALLTHMGADLDYDVLCACLPERVRPAHDGLVARFEPCP